MRLIAFFLALTLGTTFSPAKEQKPIIDSASATSVTVVSDTTGSDTADYTDSALDSNPSNRYDSDFNIDGMDDITKFIGIPVGIFVILIIFIVLFFPILIILAILFFVVRSRNREKRMQYEMAQQYLKRGEKVPESLLKKPISTPNNLYEKGIKNIFLGLGIAVFCYYFFSSMAFAAIGLIILFNGIGQTIIAKKRMEAPEHPFQTQEKNTENKPGDEHRPTENNHVE